MRCITEFYWGKKNDHLKGPGLRCKHGALQGADRHHSRHCSAFLLVSPEATPLSHSNDTILPLQSCFIHLQKNLFTARSRHKPDAVKTDV